MSYVNTNVCWSIHVSDSDTKIITPLCQQMYTTARTYGACGISKQYSNGAFKIRSLTQGLGIATLTANTIVFL